MSPKLRKIKVRGTEYLWRTFRPNGDGDGGIGLRVFEGRKILMESWLGSHPPAITPSFVAAQIEWYLEPVQFARAAGTCVCSLCGDLYYDHPQDGPYFEGYRWLHRLCNGELVKL